MTVAHSSRRGFTLAELMVVIMVLGAMAAVAGIAIGASRPVPLADVGLARVVAARDSALRAGRPVTVEVAVDGAVYLATAFPDGRVVTDAPLRISPLSGRDDHAAR